MNEFSTAKRGLLSLSLLLKFLHEKAISCLPENGTAKAAFARGYCCCFKGSSRHHKHKELSETAASIPYRKEEGGRTVEDPREAEQSHQNYDQFWTPSESIHTTRFPGARSPNPRWRTLNRDSHWLRLKRASWRHVLAGAFTPLFPPSRRLFFLNIKSLEKVSILKSRFARKV